MLISLSSVITYTLLLIIISVILRLFFRKNRNRKSPTTFDENNAFVYFKWLLYVWYNAMDFKVASFEAVQKLTSLNREDGMVQFYIPGIVNYVALFDGRTVQPILENANAVNKGDFYTLFRPWLGNALLVNPGDTWRRRRKLLTPTFHFRILDNFLPIMDEHSRNLVETLKEQEGKEWINIIPFIADCSLDIICETAMGIGSKARNEESSCFFTSMTTVCEMIVERVFHIWKRWNFFFYVLPEGRKFKQHLKAMNKYILQVIEERKSALEQDTEREMISTESENCYGGMKRKPFLDLILDFYFTNPDYTLENVKEEVSGIMFGGLETTTYTGSWTLYLLGKHPEIQRKVQKEIDEIFRNDPSRSITGEDLKMMKYTECVIKESMRLYPAGPIIGRTLKEDIECCGYTIPKGAHCVVLIYQLHRDPKVFPDPESFNPDRFLQENSTGRNSYSYIPFSAGIRNCIGQRFGMMELKTVLTNVMRNFDVESLDEFVQPVLSVILRPHGPLRLKIKRRKNN